MISPFPGGGAGRAAPRVDVFIFWTAVPRDGDFGKLLSRLDENEQARAARFHFNEDRNAFIAAHGLLRDALDRIAGIRPWRFRQMPGGKPVLDGESGRAPHFSLSHTRSMVAAAVGWYGPLGVDVETVTDGPRREDVAGLAFSAKEQASLSGLTGEAWNDAFFTLWTLKEAAVKATGQGLSADLPGFAFALSPPRLCTPGPDGSDPAEWQFHACRVVNCRLAAALRAAGPKAAFHVSEIAFQAL
ncbi:4'-phosphopantetheinyl transferase family protein [Telmatospirillum siberiense]|nr:4'-phosphopantetheinyl transferase superfamily protein [Telmatospirillum siberiense]